MLWCRNGFKITNTHKTVCVKKGGSSAKVHGKRKIQVHLRCKENFFQVDKFHKRKINVIIIVIYRRLQNISATVNAQKSLVNCHGQHLEKEHKRSFP